MNTSQELTIVIPAKNEAELLPRLLDSIARQDAPGIRETTVYVADANSTDGTVELALNFRGRIDVRVIAGGLPSAGRNAGARLATTPYLLFLDADMELGGFHEQALYAEDYLLSKKVARRKFGIVRGKALTTNRRFRKMGHIKIMGMFFKTALNTWNDNYFLRDHHYWHS